MEYDLDFVFVFERGDTLEIEQFINLNQNLTVAAGQLCFATQVQVLIIFIQFMWQAHLQTTLKKSLQMLNKSIL